jgi:hypothetical protein
VIDVPNYTLAASGSDLYSFTYDGMNQNGSYRMVVYARDIDQNEAIPFSIQASQGYTVMLPIVIR